MTATVLADTYCRQRGEGSMRTGPLLYSTLHFQGADNLDLSIQVIKASIWKCPAGRWNFGEINGCCSLYPATSSIIWWTAWNRLGCQVLIKIEMNWSAHNSLRQSNSVIFFFAGYNLLVKVDSWHRGAFSQSLPTIFHSLRNHSSLFTYQPSLFDIGKCHFHREHSWFSQLCHDLPSTLFCFLSNHVQGQLGSPLVHKIFETLWALLVFL